MEEHEYTPDQIRELSECSGDIMKFLKYIKIINVDAGEVPFEPYEYQRDFIKLVDDNRFSIGLWTRQSGKSTVVCAYALWFAIFNSDKVINIVSNKEKSAKKLLRRLKKMYECLPAWIKPGAERYAETMVFFDNGTTIEISATSDDAFRGDSSNLLIMDEFAFVPKGQADAFWASNYPTVSSSKKAKIVIISTPNGMYNLFHKLWLDAEKGINSFKHMRVSYNKVPGRDEKWAEEEKRNIGETRFRQEYAVEFLGSTKTVIDANVLEIIMNNYKNPVDVQLDGRLLIYEKPEDHCKYVLGCDVGKGTGEHDSAIQVLKVNSLKPINFEQVAIFKDNETDVYNFSEIIDRVSNYYNKAYIMVENNAEGAAVVNELWWNIENDRLVNSGTKTANLGVRATRSTKPVAVLLMKKLIEDYSLTLVDEHTLNQLSSFIEKNGKFFGDNISDDLVSALYWAVYILKMDILDETFEFKKNEKVDEGWGVLVDSDFTIEEDWSWLTNTNLS